MNATDMELVTTTAADAYTFALPITNGTEALGEDGQVMGGCGCWYYFAFILDESALSGGTQMI